MSSYSRFSDDAEAPSPQYTERENVTQGASLPSYTEAVPQRPPPSYDSLCGRVKAARDKSSGIVDFLKTFLVIILSTIGFIFYHGISIAAPVSMIAMGVIYRDDCPCEPMIPIYLIAAGSLQVAKTLYNLIQRCRKDEQEREEDQAKVNPFESCVNYALYAWFIAGMVYIAHPWDEHVFSPKDSDKYCDPTLYDFAILISPALLIINAKPDYTFWALYASLSVLRYFFTGLDFH